jgi:bacillithiol biosynthesis cysteine-adding enzyme BshC
MTAVRWAQQLTESGTDAVPVFWLATEDHDLAEVNHCFWVGRNGLEKFELKHGKEVAGMRVGEVPLGNNVLELVHRAAALLEGPAAEEIARALEASYRPEESLGSAFGKLMARLLSDKGVILLDPLDKRLHRIVSGVYRKAIEANDQLIRELVARSELLDRSGYHAQVKVTDQSTLLFLNVDGRRLPLRRQGDQFVAGRAKLSQSEVLDRIENAPESVTPNVLLRPIVQDALLPTAAYVGGPAETAYMAQAEVVYRQLLGRMPAILPRAGFTLIETQIARLLKKYRLTISDVLRGRQHLRRTMEQQSVPKGLARRFAENEKTLRRVLKGLQAPLRKLDKTLLGALESSERKMLYQLTKLQGKAGRAENLRTGVLDKHERMLLDSLDPQHGLQERSLCLLPFLAAHGRELLDELERRSIACPAQHQVVFL